VALGDQIEPICVHDLHPGVHEVVDELLLVVILGIDLCIRAEDRV